MRVGHISYSGQAGSMPRHSNPWHPPSCRCECLTAGLRTICAQHMVRTPAGARLFQGAIPHLDLVELLPSGFANLCQQSNIVITSSATEGRMQLQGGAGSCCSASVPSDKRM